MLFWIASVSSSKSMVWKYKIIIISIIIIIIIIIIIKFDIIRICASVSLHAKLNRQGVCVGGGEGG